MNEKKACTYKQAFKVILTLYMLNKIHQEINSLMLTAPFNASTCLSIYEFLFKIILGYCFYSTSPLL